MFKDELDEASKREENEQIDLQQYKNTVSGG